MGLDERLGLDDRLGLDYPLMADRTTDESALAAGVERMDDPLIEDPLPNAFFKLDRAPPKRPLPETRSSISCSSRK
jgi:hypothetical protein